MNIPASSQPEPRHERTRQLFVFLGSLIVLVSLPTIVFQQYRGNRSQDDHHAQTVKADRTIISLEREVRASQKDHATTLNEIKSLATAVNNVIAGLPAADMYLGSLAQGLEKQITALCSATHAGCPSLNTSSP